MALLHQRKPLRGEGSTPGPSRPNKTWWSMRVQARDPGPDWNVSPFSKAKLLKIILFFHMLAELQKAVMEQVLTNQDMGNKELWEQVTHSHGSAMD